MDLALRMNGEGYFQKIKGELLMLIHFKCDSGGQWLKVKERALKSCIDLRPEDGRTLHMLGAALC